MIIAGIGSRETPKDILTEMTKIGAWCKENRTWVRSGHACGADQAFEEGAQEWCIVYLPWAGFEKDFKSSARIHVFQQSPQALEIAKKYHPSFDSLSQGAKLLMARNGMQVLGSTFQDPVSAVVCWTSDGKASGGTGQALRIAKANGIRVINMYWTFSNTAEKVIDLLRPQEVGQTLD